MRSFAAIAAMSLGLSACSTTQVYSNQLPGEPAPVNTTGVVQVFYSYPPRPYEVVGVVSAKRYKPGWTDPTVSDTVFQLRDAALKLGADAVVIRSSRTNNDRHNVVEAEAIRFTGPQPPTQPQPPGNCVACKDMSKGD